MHFLQVILCESSFPLLSMLDVFCYIIRPILLNVYCKFFITYYLFHIDLSIIIFSFKHLAKELHVFLIRQITMLPAAIRDTL
jgi:hypothetical protein